MSQINKLFSSIPTSLSIVIIGCLIGLLGYVLPFQILSYYSETYRPCGDTWAGFGCAVGLFSLSMLVSRGITLLGLVVLFLILRSAKVNNLALIFASSFVFYAVILPTVGINEYVLTTTYQALYTIPSVLLAHYLIFGKLKKGAFGLRPSILSLVIWTICIGIFLGGIKYGEKAWAEYNVEKVRPEVEKMEQVEDPKSFIATYQPQDTEVTLKKGRDDFYISPYYPHEVLRADFITHIDKGGKIKLLDCYESRSVYYDRFWRLFWIEIEDNCTGGDSIKHYYGPYRYSLGFQIPN